MISYVVQPGDTLPSIASSFGVRTEAISGANRPNPRPFETIFIPVSQLPNLTQPIAVPSSPAPAVAPAPARKRKDGAVVGLAIGLGICGIVLILVGILWVCGVGSGKRREMEEGLVRKKVEDNGGIWKGNNGKGIMEVDLMADVSDCLDKYRVFRIEELKEATDGFSERSLIQGSVYKGSIGGIEYAIKKMKWNAYEQLKILQKVTFSYLFIFNFRLRV